MELKEITTRERAVIDTITMQMSMPQALEYLRVQGFEMKQHSLENWRTKIKKKTREYLHIIAGLTFEKQHLDRINELELIKKLMWDAYREEEKPLNQVRILSEIKDVQRYLSAYYEATPDFISNKSLESYRKKYNVDEEAKNKFAEDLDKK